MLERLHPRRLALLLLGLVIAGGLALALRPRPRPTPVAKHATRPLPLDMQCAESAPAPRPSEAPSPGGRHVEIQLAPPQASSPEMLPSENLALSCSAPAIAGAATGPPAGKPIPGGSAPGGAPLSVRVPAAAWNTETYDRIEENPFKAVLQEPLSTFGVDVDTASYSNVRRFLGQGSLPPRDAVRLEELVNYFHYAYPQPEGPDPFGVNVEVLACPWAPAHRLVRIGLQGRRIELDRLPPRNLTFLIDISGSMEEENKLPLVKRGLQRLCENLRPQDSVAIVVYAGNTAVILEPTSGAAKGRIQEAIGRLQAGGGTYGEGGIQLAYRSARKHFQKGADNRVILCTDGDFNIGVSDRGSLVSLIEKQRASGVFLTCLGFGMGNVKDATLVQLADKGNGHYAYIDTLREMERVFGEGGASLVTIAKDVKLQVEFNPARVKAYRLLGYEKRLLAKEDFHDDAKDAGEINAGHAVTALYELVPPGARLALPPVDALKYQQAPVVAGGPELLTLKLRWKAPDAGSSRLRTYPVLDAPRSQADPEARFAAAVATFGMLLRDSPHKGVATYELAHALARGSLGADPRGERAEFLGLLRNAQQLDASRVARSGRASRPQSPARRRMSASTPEAVTEAPAP